MIEAMSTEFSTFLQAEQDTFQANHQRRILLFGPLLSKSQPVCISNRVQPAYVTHKHLVLATQPGYVHMSKGMS